MGLELRVDDLTHPAVHALLDEHLQDMYATSPPESVHALDLGKLRQPNITMWTLWEGDALMGCGALKQLDATHGEIKSMRTPKAQRRVGAGRILLNHILGAAQTRGLQRLSLETGSQPFFEPARRLYASAGFVVCGPFADYTLDPLSVFMTKTLD